MSVEGGFVVVDINEVTVRLKEPPVDEDVVLRLDISIIGVDEELVWISSENTRMFSTSELKTFKKEEIIVEETSVAPQTEEGDPETEEAPEGEEGEGEESGPKAQPADYVVSFENTLRSSYISLLPEAIGKICNTSFVAKVSRIKGEEDAKEEELLFQTSINLSDVIGAKGTTITSESNTMESENENVDTSSCSAYMRVACDNDLAEYVSGGNVLSWTNFELKSLPSSWGLQYIVEPDPKAKVEPTEEENRAKWLEGITSLAEAEGNEESATLDFIVESDGCMEGMETFPAFKLAQGKISFNSERAGALPITTDVNNAPGLWSVQWSSPPSVFLHRSAIRSIQSALAVSDTAALSIVVHKKPKIKEGEEEVEPVDTGLTASLSLPISSVLTPGVTENALVADFIWTPEPSIQADAEVTEGITEENTLEAAPVETSADDVGGEGGEVPEETPQIEPPAPPTFSVTVAFRNPLVSSATQVQTGGIGTSGSISTLAASPSGRAVTAKGVSRDVMREFKVEIQTLISKVAQEYIAMFPLSDQEASDEMVDSEEKVKEMKERRTKFMYQISSSGVYHLLKERLKPRVQRVIRERFGARGRALGMAGKTPGSGYDSADDAVAAADSLLQDIYVYLLKECNSTLNAAYRNTIVSAETKQMQGAAVLDDEAETPTETLNRLKATADNAEADGRLEECEQTHLERIQLIAHEASLGSDKTVVHDAYMAYAKNLLSRAGRTYSDDNIRMELLAKGREVVDLALNADGGIYKSRLFMSAIAGEVGQPEVAIDMIFSCIELQLSPSGKGGLIAIDEFDGYESDKLCPVDPICYGVLCALYTQGNMLLRARKALRMGSKSFEEGDYQPPVEQHGKPRKTAVLLMSQTALYLYQSGMFTLAQVATKVAADCDAAATAKANARNLAPDTVPHLRHMLHQAKAFDALTRGQGEEAIEAARLSVLSAADNASADEVNGWLTVAQVQVALGWPTSDVTDSYQRAVSASVDVLPLEAYLSYAKLLLGAHNFESAIKIALQCANVYPQASSAFLIAGVSFLRMERLTDAEDCLQEANLLDNRNPEVWAFLSLLCLQIGDHRGEEGDKAIQQAMRLKLSNHLLLREIALAYVAKDKLLIAEDLIRRAASIEADSSATQKASAFTRKVIADILLAQNMAAEAVDAYQDIIADEAADDSMRIAAGEKCAQLLNTLGRYEEMYQLNSILVKLR